MNKNVVITFNNRRQEISPLKPHILNPIKKFIQVSLQMPLVIFLHDFDKISTKVEKCGKNDFCASGKHHTH